MANKFLGRMLGGVDLVEAGYRQRSGISLESHLALLDTFLRQGYWVTANGANDNHTGSTGSWAGELNRVITTVWAASAGGADLLDALRAGRAFVGELSSFHGYLDLSVEGNPMGSVSIRPDLSTREVWIAAVDLPAGSTVEVVRGPVDYSGALDPGTVVVRQLSAGDFTSGSASVGVDPHRRASSASTSSTPRAAESRSRIQSFSFVRSRHGRCRPTAWLQTASCNPEGCSVLAGRSTGCFCARGVARPVGLRG